MSSATFPFLPCVYRWLQVGDQRCSIKVLLDSGATHCFVSPSVALRWPQACWPLGEANSKSVSQADGSRRETHSSFTVSLVLGSLDEETSFAVYHIGCGVDAWLGYGWLASHNLKFLYEEGQVSMCEKAGCPDSTR